MPAIAPAGLTKNQIRSFWASWGGWALDGMDSFIYALVMVPALKDLLPRSGIAVTANEIGYYGGLLFALFLVGWGFAFLWGPLGDRFGRVKTLMLTILCYSLFTFLGAVATSVWQLAAFRFLAGLGIGGEWSLGGILVAEEWPEHRRLKGGGWMHTGYYFGIFLAALLNYWVGAHYGWRAMFAVGGTPALLVAFIRTGVKEPERWTKTNRPRTFMEPLAELFSPALRKRTILNTTYLLVSMTGLWAGSVYVPSSVTHLAASAGYDPVHAAEIASYATMLLSFATILGCLAMAPLAERLGRRLTLALYFALMCAGIAAGFGWAFYFEHNALFWFLTALFVLGFGGANFAMYTLWLPEQYPTECRASAFAFATSAGRFVASGITFAVGAAVGHYHTIGMPVAWTAVAFAIGIVLLPFGEETRGKPLPA
jgi:MFS family permease